ncbi:Crp/Fnr family transcriptional regulator [Fibrisoma montanum]|uniref:Crp/Fnr family transcriptional regulator n=1 Tax=Fibrisoma montanum TaxID=2305895 RepID=A0A418M3W9_9BACT|nr:cyclic nucleotide-binding domain-containing protein [Fibrisoma montanum]RIV20458.1 Crp/Fnr family transcriptional regulator [Fibrisoma montanum]
MDAGVNNVIETPSQMSWIQRALGVRQEETRTVGLFFLHNFLLGIGTILVYVAANAILLENNPEASLPIAYIASAIAMMAVGKLYEYVEHHLLLSRLAGRALIAVVVMTAVIGVLVIVGHSVAAAVTIMVGYRLIYLLTNLEFWGVSAVVFDTRQSKRLFSVISSGDMPAKAMGAILAVLVHAHTDILRLLVVAFVAFGAALYTLRLTIQSHEVYAPHRPARVVKRARPRFVEQLFGGSELVFMMCLSVATIATVATQIEYNFFVNVKHRFHAQEDVIRYVGIVLALTYGVAMIVKLLLSRHALDRFGVRRSLLVLPLTALVGLLGLEAMAAVQTDTTRLLIYFCGLYLVFEVARRALFDPVFLVLFQPLSPQQRLHGHTLAKGMYEPLGIGLAGVLLYIIHALPALEFWMPVAWIALMITALVLLQRTYRHYVTELNDAIARRFLESDQIAIPTEALNRVADTLQSANPDEVVAAIGWLERHNPPQLGKQTPMLLNHPTAAVRRRTLDATATLDWPVPTQLLYHQALYDTEPTLRERASYLISRRADTEVSMLAPLLHHSDIAIRQGAIRGTLEIQPANADALGSLTALTKESAVLSLKAALSVVQALRLTAYVPFVRNCLTHSDTSVVKAALQTAGVLRDPELTQRLVDRLSDGTYGRTAANSLKAMGADVLPLLTRTVEGSPDRLVAARIAGICEGIRTNHSRQLLIKLASQPSLAVRATALRALSRFGRHPADDELFERLVDQEVALAHRLLHGSYGEDAELTDTLDYELTLLLQRLFYALEQRHDRNVLDSVRIGVAHPSRERRANALERLDNLVPRPVYQTMQALIDDQPRAERIRLIDAALGPLHEEKAILPFIIEQGQTLFSDWTVSVALRRWTPGVSPASTILHYLDAIPLLRDSVVAAMQHLQTQQPRNFSDLLKRFPDLSSRFMSHSSAANSRIPEIELIMVLKGTSLFAQTPENVLSSIAPIMNEVTYAEGQTVFNKGDLGSSMFVIYAGEIGIYDSGKQLARFKRGDFFGELALLDAEARSATAEALTDVRLLRIDQEDFYDLMEERGEVLRSIVRTLCQRIRVLNQTVTRPVG